MTTHVQARIYAQQALERGFGGTVTPGETKALAGIACIETRYGDGWKGAGKGSNNQGAIQCGSSWKGDRFSYVDTHPNSDGTSTKYKADFRKYNSPIAGWFDLVSVAFVNRGRSVVREAAVESDFFRVSQLLRQTGYYEGVGKTAADRVNSHYRALSKAIAEADAKIAPVVPISLLPGTVRRGMRGEAVKLLQRELRIAADGEFGTITERYLRRYQVAHSLTVDGICGRKTWETLFADSWVPS